MSCLTKRPDKRDSLKWGLFDGQNLTSIKTSIKMMTSDFISDLSFWPHGAMGIKVFTVIFELVTYSVPKIYGREDSTSDVGGQHCPCPVLVSFLSDLSGKSCPVSVWCLDSVWIFCSDSICLDSARFPDSVRNCMKNANQCLSVRPDKDDTEPSGVALSLSADVCSTCCWKFRMKLVLFLLLDSLHSNLIPISTHKYKIFSSVNVLELKYGWNVLCNLRCQYL